MATGVQTTLAHLRRQEEERRAAGRARADRIRQHLPEVARRLRARGAERIWLFGSMASSDPAPGADVDLAVMGLPGSCYFEVLAELMETLGAVVDLVRIEEAPASLVARIEAEGVSL
jgi:predicted nucleotidyltransferase